ncbi:MAG: type I DNA topoisomerase [Mariprofundales bacterium]
MSSVVVVESPAKAKTIEKYLGAGYKVLASYGHVRGFPKRDGSVDPDNDFALTYIVLDDRKKRLDAIQKALKKADSLILASDLDREGEAIAWHVYDELKKRGAMEGKQVSRITFNEITRRAIKQALENAGNLNTHLVEAQQARSALDYLVGFTLSPLLWRKIRSGLSAGRVQSVGLRLICEREDEIKAFNSREYWTIEAQCNNANGAFLASLYALDGKKLAKFDLNNQSLAQQAANRVQQSSFTVSDVQKTQKKQTPPPPFITSTLQMEASRKLGFTARKTMQVAQKLYEGVETANGEREGLITYMRTDSVSLASEAIDNIRSYISEKYSAPSLPTRARIFKSKSKNAQEAHEAIRPTNVMRTAASLRGTLDNNASRLYELIWKRAVASQMALAILDQMRADISSNDNQVILRATGSAIAFAGFRALYNESSDDDSTNKPEAGMLPALIIGDVIDVQAVKPLQHFTEPKPRYTEATLVKSMEGHGIGRPSTYASILSVLRDRKYVEMDKKRFVPTDTGEIVNRFLVSYFENIINVDFTSGIEDKLDAIARGESEWKPVLRDFWQPFKLQVDDTQANVTRAQATHESTDEKCPECEKELVIKLGRYGRFMACIAYPDCRYSRPIKGDNDATEAPATRSSDEICTVCGEKMVIKTGRYGDFLTCSQYPKCKHHRPLEKPKETGVDCPKCGKGVFIEKKSRRGKIFYSCSCYPKCKNALWDKPLPQACPSCKSSFVTEKNTKRRGRELICVQEECEWRVQADDNIASAINIHEEVEAH